MTDNPQTTDFPAGAIHNGRAFMERLESIQIEGSAHIQNFTDWGELKKCFEHLVSFIEEHHAA